MARYLVPYNGRPFRSRLRLVRRSGSASARLPDYAFRSTLRLILQDCGKTETKKSAPVLRIVPAAVRRPAKPGAPEPAAAASDAEPSLGGNERIDSAQ